MSLKRLAPFGVTAFWLIVCLWFGSDAAVDLIPLMAILIVSLAMATVWLIVAIVTVIRWRKSGLKLRASLTVKWLVVHGAAMLTVIPLGLTNVGLNARTRLSANALLSAGCESRGRIGLFNVREHECIGECRRFITAHDFLDDAGVAYCPAGRPPVVGEDSYSHLYGGWWRWYRSW